MTPNDGDHVDDLILGELDGAIGAVERKTIESHIVQCLRCAAMRVEQRSLQRTLAGPPVSSADLTRGHDLVWKRLAEPRDAHARGFWRSLRGPMALIATITLAAGIALTFVLAQGAARPDSGTVVIAQRDVSLPPAAGTFIITERLASDGNRQVAIATDLHLVPSPTTGLLEIRVERTGEGHGILAALPSLAGVSRARIEGIFPPLPDATSQQYDVWIHLEVDGRVYDSRPIPIRVTSDRTGTHARAN